MHNIENFFIGGTWSAPHSRSVHRLINPATEEETCEIPMADAVDVDRAVSAAKSAFNDYSSSSVEERISLLRKLLSLYNDAYDELAELMTLEMGSTIAFSKEAQAFVGAEHIKAAIESLENFDFDELRSGTLITKEPIGVCALITPWNWPMNQLVVKAAPCLAAGCTMVVKASEFSPLSSIRFAELIEQAGFPPGAYNHITGYGEEAGAALSGHKDVDMVSITGSTRAGIAVAKNAADTVKRVTQELGGKSANIILDDADFENAVKSGVRECFINCGQACRAPSRMLVPANKMEDAKRYAEEAANEYRVGDPATDVDLGPVVNKTQYSRIQKLIQSGISEGATVVSGGVGKPEGLNKGYYVKPTVFADVTPEMTVAKDEIFGPVLCVLGYRDEQEALKIANDTKYGLSGYVQSKDIVKARKFARALRVGTIWLNGAAWEARAPFGGYKQSGNGREHDKWGLEEFLEVKSIAGYSEF